MPMAFFRTIVLVWIEMFSALKCVLCFRPMNLFIYFAQLVVSIVSYSGFFFFFKNWIVEHWQAFSWCTFSQRPCFCLSNADCTCTTLHSIFQSDMSQGRWAWWDRMDGICRRFRMPKHTVYWLPSLVKGTFLGFIYYWEDNIWMDFRTGVIFWEYVFSCHTRTVYKEPYFWHWAENRGHYIF